MNESVRYYKAIVAVVGLTCFWSAQLLEWEIDERTQEHLINGVIALLTAAGVYQLPK